MGFTLSEFEVILKVAKSLYKGGGGGGQSRGLKLRDGSVYTFPIFPQLHALDSFRLDKKKLYIKNKNKKIR